EGVTVAAADVSDGDSVRAVLWAIPSDLPLRGVVHAAGVLDDGGLSGQSAERFARVLTPKVGGACHLDALTRGAGLDFFVLFSSVMGALGSAGPRGDNGGEWVPGRADAAPRVCLGRAWRGGCGLTRPRGRRGWRRGWMTCSRLALRRAVWARWTRRKALRCSERRWGEAKRSSCRCRSSWVC